MKPKMFCESFKHLSSGKISPKLCFISPCLFGRLFYLFRNLWGMFFY